MLRIKILLILLLLNTLDANERIIVLSPSINEIVFALGKGDAIVGNTTYCKYPQEAKNITKVGGYFNPSLEKILSLNPSLIIMQQNNYKLNQKLQKLGLKTKVIKIDKLINIKKAILDIGIILKQTKQAKKIIQNIDDELKQLKGITKNKKILIVMGHNVSLKSRIFVAGENLYFNDIIEFSENKNAFKSDKRGQPILNMENIIATNPDIVILLSPMMKEKKVTKADLINPWKSLPINAAKTNSIFIIDKTYSGIPSDRLIYFLKDFREILNASCQ